MSLTRIQNTECPQTMWKIYLGKVSVTRLGWNMQGSVRQAKDRVLYSSGHGEQLKGFIQKRFILGSLLWQQCRELILWG